MLSGLNKAEKTPNKGWKFLPVYEETEEVSDNEDEDEVMLLEDKNEESSKSGVTKRCLSSQFKDPHEYVAKDFKIPKKSSSQNSCHGNNSSLSDKGNSSQTSCDNHSSKRDINWGFESAFPETNHSSIQTRLTRNSSFRNKTSKTNIRRMVQRQDGLRSGIFETRQNLNNSLEQVKVGYFRRKKKNNEPFEQEINMIKEKKRRTSNSPENNLIESDERKYKVNRRTEVSEKSKTNHESDQESQNISIKKGIPDEETTSSDETGDQYFENLYQEKLHAMSSNPEKDSKQKVMTESQERDCEENSAKENACQQCKLINFPSAAATPRHSIHEYSTSEDDKGKESNTKSFYGSLSKPKLKTYGNKKGRRMNDKKQWTNDNDDKEISIATSDVDDSPATNAKKRKAANKKSAKNNNNKNENSNSEKQRKKHKTEPACYLISSSDEEDNHSGLEDGNISGPESSMPKNNSERDSKSSSKATDENSACMATVNGSVDNPFERDSFTTEIMLGPKVMLGKLQGTTYGALEITAHQLKWKMKYNDNGKSVEQVVLILAGELTSFKIHVDSDPKIIVLGVSPGCALKLRGKFSGLGKFFDPGSPVMEETEIVLQVDDALSPETMADITEWVKDRLCKSFKELSLNEAEQLSERLNSSNDSGTKCVDPKQTTHYNTRSSVVKTTARTTGVTPTKMIIYPAPPIHGGITVTSADVECLAEGQFLNDVIIDFYLKYIYHDKLSEEDKKRTHIFSSFFYKRLTQKSSSSNNDLFQNAHDRMHNQVKKWTRHVDIFSKDFIIVPINESSHWYLAIICFPYLDEPIIEESSKQQELEENIIEDSTDSEGKEKAKEDVNVDEKTNKDDHDESENDTDLEKSALAVSAKIASPSKKTARKNKPVIKANPSILIFDSLGTGGRSRVFKNLRNYLSCEWKARRPDEQTREFTSDSFKGAFPKVPEQHNHCDCGIFVLQYVESFFEDPIRDYKIPIHKNHWFTHDGISGKRQEIKSLILRLKEKYQSIPS